MEQAPLTLTSYIRQLRGGQIIMLTLFILINKVELGKGSKITRQTPSLTGACTYAKNANQLEMR